MLKRFLILAVVIAAAGAASMMWSPSSQAQPGYGMDEMAIDMDPGGVPANTATSIGSREPCARINENNLLDADETGAADQLAFDITADGIPATTAMFAFQASFFYDESAFDIVESDVDWMLASHPTSGPIHPASDPIPDVNSGQRFTAAGIDTGIGAIPEFGNGVLARLTIETTPSASTTTHFLVLDAENSAHIDTSSTAYVPETIGKDRYPLVPVARIPGVT